MELKMFAIHDTKAQLYGPPFFMTTRGEALRAFSDLANDGNTTVSKHPGDYQLVQVGTWNNEKGEVHPIDHESLGFASDYKAAGNIIPLGVSKP